jgi:putative DNA primase/helicase
MGAILNNLEPGQHIDFKEVNAAAIHSLETLVPELLPGGKRVAKNWVVCNPTRNDKNPSLSVSLETGAWYEFATKDKGTTFASLLQYVTGESYKDANYRLADRLGVRASTGATSLTGNIRPFPQKKPPAVVTVAPEEARTAPESFPPRTTPDESGKPWFVVAGDDGPRVRDDEKRRHIYRKGGVPIRIKVMRMGDARPYNLYRVVDVDGRTGWQSKEPEGFLKIPYFVGEAPFENDGPIYWPEGEKDAETLAKIGLPAFTFGGTGDLPEGCAEYVRGRDVIILADNDEAGRNHAEEKAALAGTVAASVKVIHFPGLAEKQDVSDWIEAGHTIDELVARAKATEFWSSNPRTSAPEQEADTAESTSEETSRDQDGKQEEPASAEQRAEDPAEEHIRNRADQKKQLPPGYGFSNRGLMYQNPDDLDKPAILIAGHFDVVAETRDGDGTNWGVLLRWKDHDNRDHQHALPRVTLAGDGSEARRLLMDGGFFVAPSQAARGLFNSFLLQVRSPNRARATQRVGWHGNSFVLPDDCYGADGRDTLLLQSATAHEHSFRQSGNLESWQQHVAKYAIDNSRLAFAISTAFAAPLLGPCAAEGGGFHFKGASSTGKSTALHVGGSPWGGGDTNGYVRSWRATANGLEGVALSHSDTLLCLDELSQLAAKDAGEAAYMLANGAGKSRSTRDGSARRQAKWRAVFLSSGEIGLADKVAEDGRGKRIAAGQQVRIVDIAADAGAGMGMFENLHGFESADALARHLRSATHQHYGVAARHYLGAIVSIIDDLRHQIAPIMKAFSEQYVPKGADGQVERVAQRFALVAVGGELAQQHGIVPWPPGEAIRAAGRCFSDWLSARGGHDAAEVRDGLEQVRSFLLANGMARFIPAWEEEKLDENLPNRAETKFAPRDIAGFRQKVGDGWDFYVTTTAWKEEVCRGLDARRLAATMAQRGYLSAEDASRRAKPVRVPGHGQLRLYHIVSDFLESGE